MIIAEHDSLLGWDKTFYSMMSVLCAYAGLLFTRSKYVMFIVLLFQLMTCFKEMPVVANHWFFAAVISLVLIGPILRQIVKDKFSNKPLDECSLERVFPVVRLLVIIMYLLAVFHKLNTLFLNPEFSCAIHIYQQIANGGYAVPLPATPPLWLRYILIYGTLAVELLIPVLLINRKTWFAGIFVGCLFHLSTGLIMRHFPSLMAALYFIFVPKNVGQQFVQQVDQIIRKITHNKLGLIGAVVLQAVLWTVWSVGVRVHDRALGIGQYRWGHMGHLSAQWLLMRFWLVLAVSSFIVFIVIVRKNRWDLQHKPQIFRTRPIALYIIPVAFVFNGLSPYLGLKTVCTISMWSNLRTFSGMSNHLIVPEKALKIFPYIDDMVELQETNIPHLQKNVIAEHRLIAFSMLKQKVQNRVKHREGKVSLTYVRGGKTYVVKDASTNPELMEPNPYLFRKCVQIKNPPKDNRGECTW